MFGVKYEYRSLNREIMNVKVEKEDQVRSRYSSRTELYKVSIRGMNKHWKNSEDEKRDQKFIPLRFLNSLK